MVFFQVMDAKLYTYGVNQPIAAIESLSATTLRLSLIHIVGSQDQIFHTLHFPVEPKPPAPRWVSPSSAA